MTLIVNFSFYFFAFMSIASALFLLLNRNVLYAAYSLLLCFLGVAGLFVLVGADFLAVTQIMVYVGGILVLLVFGIMLTARQTDLKQSNQLIIKHKNQFLGLIVCFALCAFLLKLIFSSKFIIAEQSPQQGSQIQSTGIGLMTNYVLPFELIGILLLIALIGALYLSQKKLSR